MNSGNKVHGSMKPKTSTFQWQWELNINDVEQNTDNTSLQSPTFNAYNLNFFLILYPKGSAGAEDFVAIGLALQHPLKVKVKYSISLIDNNEQNFNAVTFEEDFESNANSWVNINYISRHELLSKKHNLVQDDKLKILCEIILVDMAPFMVNPISLKNLLNNEQFSDITINVEGKKLSAHKAILADRSDVFEAMFTHRMKENLESSIDIEDIAYDTVMEMLRFIYTGTINGIDKVAVSLLFAAEKYNIIDLKLVCSKYLESNLSINNVVEYLQVAEKCNLDILKSAGTKFILSNAKKMATTPDFKSIMSLDEELVLEIMKNLALDKK